MLPLVLKSLTRKEIATAYREAQAMEIVSISMDELKPLEIRLMVHLKGVIDYYGQQEGDYTIGTDFTALYEQSSLTKQEAEEALQGLLKKQVIRTMNDNTTQYNPLISKCYV